ncbi:MAG: hypothetical protein COC19_07415 [SAR86 cluster bacterium]|uniref:SPOR domain-containing protein n=1 Tax=SAR86 cluster bacterium TaxID=2030880 RepID=A0A2A4MHV5_9GAMM|nr:MAG: hypothetical protein COC19_07415 [SAR86 cluster bacterium]
MNQSTKQRIVGTVVLIAVGLIVLPMVFDGQGSYQRPIESRIPNPPVITLLAQPQPQRPTIVADSDAILIEATRVSPTVTTVVAASTDDAEIEPNAEPAQVDSSEQSGVQIANSTPVFSRITSLDEKGLPQAWSVRLGAYSDTDNANKLVEQLKAAGFKAYIREIVSGQGMLTGVFVGPWVERSKVDQYQQQLQQQFPPAGIVVPFEIEQLN